NPSQLCSHWLVDADARLVQCRHHPSPELLAAVANNQKEQRARHRVLAQYANKFAGYKAFADAYVHAMQSGRSMDTIAPEGHPSTVEVIHPQSQLDSANSRHSITQMR
ncbi:hypothetical protein C7B61_11370, partial [filamentous cyanobacterium CCP1]